MLGLRTFALADDAEFDSVVPMRSLVERIVRARSEVGDDESRVVSMSRPPEVNTVTWAGISPPRGGWRALGETDAARLESAARAGIDEVATAIPDGTGEQLVQRVRSEVWGRGVEGLEYVPAGAAFAAFSLGFLGDDPVRLFETGPWTQAHVASRACARATQALDAEGVAAGRAGAAPHRAPGLDALATDRPFRGDGSAGGTTREEASAEERSLERAVAVHAAAAEARGSPTAKSPGTGAPSAPSARESRSVWMPPRLLRVRIRARSRLPRSRGGAAARLLQGDRGTLARHALVRQRAVAGNPHPGAPRAAPLQRSNTNVRAVAAPLPGANLSGVATPGSLGDSDSTAQTLVKTGEASAVERRPWPW